MTFASTSCAETSNEGPCDIRAANPFAGSGNSDLDRRLIPLRTFDQSATLPLGSLQAAVFFGDGVAVATHESQEVVILAADGGVLARQGGPGYGPAEYVNLNGVARYEAGLVAWDAFHLRLTQMDGAGKVTGQVSIRGRAPPYHRGTLVGTSGQTALLRFDPSGYRGMSNEPVRVRQDVTFLNVAVEDGVIRDSLTLPGEELWAVRDGRAHGGIPVVFGRHATSAVTPAGMWFVDTEHPRLLHYTDRGHPCQVDFDYSSVVVSAAWIDHARDSIRAAIDAMRPGNIVLDDGQNLHIKMQAFRTALVDAGLPSRSTLPFLSDIRGAKDGTLWLKTYPEPGDSGVTWVGLDRTFSPKARFRPGTRMEVLDIDGNRVLTVEDLPDGDRRLVVYEIKS